MVSLPVSAKATAGVETRVVRRSPGEGGSNHADVPLWDGRAIFAAILQARSLHPLRQRWPGGTVMHDVWVALFAMTAGFTASGISANLYHLLVKEAHSSVDRAIFVAVMIVAGPSVLFEKAAKAWREKACSGVAFWLAAALAGYWSLAIGLLVIQVALALKAR